MRSQILVALASVCLFALPGCEDTGTPPKLSDLMINTDVSAAVVGQSLNIEGTVTVSDPDGDVDQLRVTVNLPDGSAQDLPTRGVEGTDGLTDFSVELLMVMRPPVSGSYRVDVRVDDEQGNLSAPASFTVTAR